MDMIMSHTHTPSAYNVLITKLRSLRIWMCAFNYLMLCLKAMRQHFSNLVFTTHLGKSVEILSQTQRGFVVE